LIPRKTLEKRHLAIEDQGRKVQKDEAEFLDGLVATKNKSVIFSPSPPSFTYLTLPPFPLFRVLPETYDKLAEKVCILDLFLVCLLSLLFFPLIFPSHSQRRAHLQAHLKVLAFQGFAN